MEQMSCIFCGTPSRDVAITEKGFTGVRCNNCNLIYISPRPNTAEVTHLYTDEHAVLYADAQFQFDGFNRMEAARTLSKIKRYKTGGSILELGPGGGFFLSEARNWGYEPYGVELNPVEARWINGKLRIPCENAPLSANSFNGKQFDIIYHKDVLSHLADPISVFCDMNRALKKDGLLVFETGNIADVHENYMK
jgi:2-polyprenyl-3-methyl-5-hydroxy-6-metoxy-1,4-benzoquinol methylase